MYPKFGGYHGKRQTNTTYKKSFPDKVRDAAMIIGTTAIIGTGIYGRYSGENNNSSEDEQAKSELADFNKKLSKKYKITDEASFK